MEALVYTPSLKPTGNRHSFPHYPTSEMVPLTIQCFHNMTNQHGFSLLFHYKQHCLLCLIPKNRAQEHVNIVTNTYHLHQRFIHLDDSVFLLSMLHTITCTPSSLFLLGIVLSEFYHFQIFQTKFTTLTFTFSYTVKLQLLFITEKH